MVHSLAECSQSATIEGLTKALEKIDAHTERTAVALEAIAAQGVMVQNHERRLNDQDTVNNRLFTILRDIEKRHAKEDGIEEVQGASKKFWTEVKLKLVVPALLALIVVIQILDEFSFFEKLFDAMEKMPK